MNDFLNRLLTYRNKRARTHVLAGALEFTKPASLDAAVDAANERILARPVEEGDPVIATNGKPIPVGDYAIVEIDEDGVTIMACEKSFFESLWEVDLPRTIN